MQQTRSSVSSWKCERSLRFTCPIVGLLEFVFILEELLFVERFREQVEAS